MRLEEAYSLMFKEYADVLTVEDMVGILQVSDKTVYGLIKSGEIKSIKVGREYRIPKMWLIAYVLGDSLENKETSKETFLGADA